MDVPKRFSYLIIKPLAGTTGRSTLTIFKFTGKPVSQTTGLYYEYQRWYDPTTGRFTSLDPSAGSLSDPQIQNGYNYARALPTVLVDPTGAVLDCNYSLCQGPPITGEVPSDISDS